jgi:hypothetical protein
MGLHQVKKLLHIKRNNEQNEETNHRIRKRLFASYSPGKGLISGYTKSSKN